MTSKSFLVNFDFKNGIKRYSVVVLAIFAMFHLHTIKIQVHVPNFGRT